MRSKFFNRLTGSLSLATLAVTVTLSSCAGDNATTSTSPSPNATSTAMAPAAGNLSGQVVIDGSSTVAPISKAIAEEFGKANADVKIPVGTSGTGGGFKKFCAGDSDIADASRPIKTKEAEECAKNNIEFVELPIAIDGLTVVVNKENTWAKCLTIAELKKIWSPDSQGKVTKWSQVRAGFPEETLNLFGPGADSGTFEYFTEVVNGKAKASRTDFQPSEDDNILVQGVSGSKGGLAYFGVAYFEENASKLTAVEIDGGKGCVAPVPLDNIISGKYSPMSRPLFIYVKKESLGRPEVKAFLDFYLAQVEKISKEVGYVALPAEAVPKVAERLKAVKVGTTFSDAPAGTPLVELLSKDLK